MRVEILGTQPLTLAQCQITCDCGYTIYHIHVGDKDNRWFTFKCPKCHEIKKAEIIKPEEKE